MALAVSLLIAPQVSSDEMDLSNFLYFSALKYLDAVFAKPEPVLHAQAYLLCTPHALHSPSSRTLLTMTSTTMRHCVISKLHLCLNEREIRDSTSLLEVQIRRRVFWSAYAIDRLVNWIYHIPCSLPDENIQTKLFALSDDEIKAWAPTPYFYRDVESAPRRTQVSSSLQLTGARRVQSRILNIMMRVDYEDKFAQRYDWRLHMLEELHQWKMQLKPHIDLQSEGYTSRQTAQLWPGLLSQFGVGITLLYCFWATNYSCRETLFRIPGISAGIRTCSVILAVFSERWKQAEALRDVFDILSNSIQPINFVSNDAEQNGVPSLAADRIKPMIPLITSLVMDDHVCRMIREMISGNYRWNDSGTCDKYLGWSSGNVHDPHTCRLSLY
ncbi:hypothetical protein N7471_007905 [Penicillium samsonianum]|uniref:uncharacterized protein n=1 Tax=Penicillium samsonianum TaxID=1882272 RepID=UPI0025475C88|nr:uncharacterized protein N7471_007905 [Penicillium samsonianum]KAJ6132690.1 hypothetical protein N7471_007905 [Penicillium samsonianum]